MRRRVLLLGLAAGLLTAPPTLLSARADAEFYKGKTVEIIIGARTGSLAVAAQLVARHLGKYIPGNPNVIFRQMPGGAHLIATGHVYNVAEANGLSVLAANPNVALAQLAKLPQVRFDVTQFQWLGSTGSDGAMFAIRADLPFKTFKEWQASGQELVAGTTGPGSNAHDFPLLLKEFAGAKLRLVTGYAANSDILLAVQRKEVDAWSALATTVQLAVDQGAVRPLVRSRTPVPGWNHLPIDEDLATSKIGRSLMAIRAIPQSIGRALAVRPGTPPERVAALREALAKVMADPEFQAEAKKARIAMDHISAEDVTNQFQMLMKQSPEVLEAMNRYLKVGGG